MLYDEAEMKSKFAKDRVEELLIEFKDQTVHRRLAQRDISIEILTPFSINLNNVAPIQKMVGKELGLILPYLIIIMCFMGAMYPAIDLAAGEKERGTLETLLVSPASRGEFVVGKYLVVLTTGIVAAFNELYGRGSSQGGGQDAGNRVRSPDGAFGSSDYPAVGRYLRRNPFVGLDFRPIIQRGTELCDGT